MKQDWEEQTIRQLFRDERQVDESQAPHFAVTLEAALSRRRIYRPRRLIFRVAFAIVALVAVVGLVRLFSTRSGSEQPAIVAENQSQPDSTPAPTIGVVTTSPNGPPPRATAGTRRHRQTPARAVSLISQWRSPTDFLLRTPGDQLLKTVPRVGTSAIELKVNFSDQKN